MSSAPDRFTLPVTDELDLIDLPVTGALPPELSGDYMRNGPNARPGSHAVHRFFDEGMVHAVRLEGGHARGYRNRWVRTLDFEGKTRYLNWNGIDLRASVANTNVVEHGGRIFALVESSFPYEVTRDLATRGPVDFDGRLKTPFTAHPKRCPRTGELHAFGMSLFAGGLTYYRIDARGALAESRRIPGPRRTMMHDFALTGRSAIFFDLPLVFDLPTGLLGKFPYRWSPERGARIGVVPRDAADGTARWYSIAPCFVFHIANAYDDGDAVVIDAVRYGELPDASGRLNFGTLHRWTVDRTSGNVTGERLDDVHIEFPRIDERQIAGHHRYVFTIVSDEGANALVRYDLERRTAQRHEFGPGRMPGEFAFVPGGDGEAEGYLLGFVYDAARDASDLVVLDATAPAQPPLATVELPVRVPAGFHGNWIPADERSD
jgi:carotenoid cleavage dioxygenase